MKKLIPNLDRVTKAIVHDGYAHLDDFLCACLILSLSNVDKIQRKTWPTDEELNDPNCIICDFGKIHSEDLLNFDHHQIKGGEQCAFTLLLDYLGMRNYNATPWIKATEIYDHCGPEKLANFLKCPNESIPFVFSPVEKAMIDIFSGYTEVERTSNLGSIMTSIGDFIVDSYQEYLIYKEEVDEKAKIIKLTNGLTIADYTSLKVEATHSIPASEFEKKNGVDITLALNTRIDGKYRLTRKNPLIDFNVCKNLDGVKFIHQSGFLILFDCDYMDIINKLG